MWKKDLPITHNIPASASLRVFESSGLLREIYLQAPLHLCAVLLSVNKIGFKTRIRIIWSHVEGVTALLSLIPGVRSRGEPQDTLLVVSIF